MNKNTAFLFLPMVTALAAGKTIQMCQRLDNPIWRDMSELSFRGDPRYYRIKPEQLRYRRGVGLSGGKPHIFVCSTDEAVRETSFHRNFLQWIDTEWQYYDYEENKS